MHASCRIINNKMQISFYFLDKLKSEMVLPILYDILYSNMNEIAPTGNSYEQDRTEWTSCILPALEKTQRQIVLIYNRDVIIGYFQYYVNSNVFMMEEIQIKKEYHGSGIFGQLYKWLIKMITHDILYVEAYANKKNIKSQAILKHLGLEIIGENKNGKSFLFRGKYQMITEKYELEK
ncbi:MAG: hypothetical protein VB118_00890 [Oscillospiraceae bacterium]|nr:hypothetical protein [Oscillospiraceae bacterium]